MKKILFLLVLVFILSGCATYRFQKGTKPPFDKGYVASYEGDILPEYTIGKDSSVPADLSLAKERFNRRRLTVEKYYKDMGSIENRIKEVFWEPPVMIFNIVIGVFKLPYIAYSDYKYENDPKYREMITKRDEDEYQKEKARIKSLKEELNKYIQKDLSQEPVTSVPEQEAKAPEVLPVEKEEAAPKQEVKVQEAALVEKQEAVKNKTEASVEKQEVVENKTETPKIEEKTSVVEQKNEEAQPKEEINPVVPRAPEPAIVHQTPVTPELPFPVVVIISRPTKGFSPLKVEDRKSVV